MVNTKQPKQRDRIGNDLENGRNNLKKYLLLCFAVLVLLCSFYALRRMTARFARDFMSPFLNTLEKTPELYYKAEQMLEPKTRLAAKVTMLDRQNVHLSAENAMLRRYQQENAELRSLLKMKPLLKYRTVPAEIIGRSSALWRKQFLLNCGKSDGVRIGDAVVAPTPAGSVAFVGRVAEVSSSTALVSTIFSDTCRISASIRRDGSAGMMEYSEQELCPILTFLPLDGDYRTGEIVETSGISDQIPGGIVIGVINGGNPNSPPAVVRDQMYSELKIRPFVKIDSVHILAVYASGKDSK